MSVAVFMLLSLFPSQVTGLAVEKNAVPAADLKYACLAMADGY